jgi:predicted ATP-grasp superfamily ATP-dependent carboligase/cation diffusion facilitator CzcD-associated flavoprotein CzcO
MPISEVAIIGAGPYGLSLAAHLQHSGADFRIFGVPMRNWREAMPAGMYLKSDGFGTNLSAPKHSVTLSEFCSTRDIPYSDHGLPIALQTFVDYALWFRQKLAPDIEECEVLEIAPNLDRFELRLDSGETMTARRVVLAVGTTYFRYVPPQLASLDRDLVSHSRDHSLLGKFSGREVIVIGGGQSALETAALLSEQGADVRVLVRRPYLVWNPPPTASSALGRLLEIQTGLGSGSKMWFYCNMQDTFQHLPLLFRAQTVKRALGPAGAWWLKKRVVGRFPVLCGHEVQAAREKGGKIWLSVTGAGGGATEMVADHVIAATGYKVDVNSVACLCPDLSRRIRRELTGPALNSEFESSVPGLYFTGLASANRFGPSMRFVFGADYAARTIVRSLRKDRRSLSSSRSALDGRSLASPQPRLHVGASARQPVAASRLDTSVPVLVLNLGEYPFHQGSLGVIRSLGKIGIPVYAVQRSSIVPSGASRYLAGKYVWKSDCQGSDQFVRGLVAIGKKLGRPTVLVAADDLSAIQVAEHAEILAENFKFARPPATLPRTVANKRSLYKLCRRLGTGCPTTAFPASREEWLEVTSNVSLPAIVKVVEPWLAPRGFKSTVIISNRQALIDYGEHFAQHASPTSLMIQEMIPAETSEDWFVHGYCDSRSNPVALFTGIKLRSYPAFAGPTTYARSVRNEALLKQVAEFLIEIGYHGILDLDFKSDGRDGRYKLLDFNPRIGAQFRLFKAADGTDVVRALYADLTGQASPVGPQVEGRTFVAEVQDLLASRAYRQSGKGGIRGWWRSLREADEIGWYDPDDPMPFFVMGLHLPLRGVARLLRFRNNDASSPLTARPSLARDESANLSPLGTVHRIED